MNRIAGPVIAPIVARLDDIRLMHGQALTRQLRRCPPDTPLGDVEFGAFSQWGEDGIIQHLLNHVAIDRRTFVEFGVEDYRESNTRFLLRNDNWEGLILDSDEAHISRIRRDPIYWRHSLTAVKAFVTRESIDQLISSMELSGDIGLLSIDIDGNDYWVWEAIQCIQPRIVICEFNSLLGRSRPVSVPYSEEFRRHEAHFSGLYFGASLAAFCHLAGRKGYKFIGCTSSGNDAFFVRDDLECAIPPRTAEQGYVLSKARESRDQAGRLTFASGGERLRIIGDMPLVDVITGQKLKVSNLPEYR